MYAIYLTLDGFALRQMGDYHDGHYRPFPA